MGSSPSGSDDPRHVARSVELLWVRQDGAMEHPEVISGVTTRLTNEELLAAQQETLASPRRRASLAAKGLFAVMDIVYGRERTLAKFRVLEVIARVPYQAWEHVAYVAVTHNYSEPRFARRIFDRVAESRAQQDNEQWHLLILEELLAEEGRHQSLIRYRLLPQLIAFVYYHLSWLMYVMKPGWSYRLNADFEDHAEHEYMEFVSENPDLALRPYDGYFTEEYGRFDSLADLFRQIGYDERMHKEESIAAMAHPRFE